jgi:uncharacterized RDD family membrane protein YckC
MNAKGGQMLDVSLEGLIEVRTPDSVVFYHPMAGISLRGAACVIDMAIQVAAILFLFLLGGILSLFVGLLADLVRWAGDVVPLVWLWAFILFLVWLVFTGYFVVFETVWNGQTPGKRLLRIRALKDTGGPVGFYEALLRNVLRSVDSFPTFYAVGIISALATAREQRLGDLVAGTVVVREPKAAPPSAEALDLEVSDEGKEFMCIVGLERLDEEDFILVRDFLERRRQLAPEHRGELSVAIASKVARKMAFMPPERVRAEWFLEAVVDQSTAEAEEKALNGEIRTDIEESLEAEAE